MTLRSSNHGQQPAAARATTLFVAVGRTTGRAIAVVEAADAREAARRVSLLLRGPLSASEEVELRLAEKEVPGVPTFFDGFFGAIAPATVTH